tara:strand:- start:2870 stop:3346 length:477 start_codon:yes stop_codon:yes gene_type:complete
MIYPLLFIGAALAPVLIATLASQFPADVEAPRDPPTIKDDDTKEGEMILKNFRGEDWSQSECKITHTRKGEFSQTPFMHISGIGVMDYYYYNECGGETRYRIVGHGTLPNMSESQRKKLWHLADDAVNGPILRAIKAEEDKRIAGFYAAHGIARRDDE